MNIRTSWPSRADFGIGQIISDEIRSQLSVSGFSQAGLESASLSGTQLYMAPELFWGKPASIRSDIYALGVVLYQLLAGDFRRPVTTGDRPLKFLGSARGQRPF